MKQASSAMEDDVWWKMLRGLTTRNYPLVTRSFAAAYGIEKSATSERFIQASRDKLKELMERPLGELPLCAIVIDGTPFKGRQMIAAIGVGKDGKKTVLCLREGATENATVVRELLEDLVRRGLDFSTPRLYVLDGAKALHAAVKRHSGELALIQRCLVHKRRNVLEQLPDEYQPAIDRQLLAAYAMWEYGDARRALEQIQRELERINPSAARSLEEGMEETLTVHKLRMPELLRKSLASTNIIESAFSVAEELCRRVKRWREGDHRERWAGSALLLAESKFRRLKGYREIPKLVTALADYGIKKGRDQERTCRQGKNRVTCRVPRVAILNGVPGKSLRFATLAQRRGSLWPNSPSLRRNRGSRKTPASSTVSSANTRYFPRAATAGQLSDRDSPQNGQ